jgi:hypothetical protein
MTAPERPDPGLESARQLGIWLAELGLDATDGDRPGEFLVQLPGQRRKSIGIALRLSGHGLRLSCFVCRQPAERAGEVYRWCLGRNLKLAGLAFALDAVGDIYLVSRIEFAQLSLETLDRLLGAYHECVEESFDELLRLGFGAAIAREWRWRKSRGEPTTNLAAFEKWLAAEPGHRGSEEGRS